MIVRSHPAADQEFSDQVEYYEQAQPGLGLQYYREVIATLEWIARDPEVPRVRRGYRRVNLRVFPHYVAYVVINDVVWIVAIAHGRRRPGFWAARLDDPPLR